MGARLDALRERSIGPHSVEPCRVGYKPLVLYVILAAITATLALLDGISRLAAGGALRDGRWFTKRTRKLRDGVRTLTGRVVADAASPFVIATVRSERSAKSASEGFRESARTRTGRPFQLTVHGGGEVRVDPENARLLVREYTRTEESDDGERTLRVETAEINGGDYVRVRGYLRSELETHDAYRSAPEATWRMAGGDGSHEMVIHRAHRLEPRDRRLVGVVEVAIAIVLGFIVARFVGFETTARRADATVIGAASHRAGGVEVTFDVDGIHRRCAVGDLRAADAQPGQRLRIEYSLADPGDCRASGAASLPAGHKVATVTLSIAFLAGLLLLRSIRPAPKWREA